MSRVIAIDGPSASGKSTVARRVAAELGRLYVDSGALYRAVTWRAMEHGVEEGDIEGVIKSLHEMEVLFRVDAGAVCFTVDGRDPGLALRTETLNRRVSEVAATPAVRDQVVAWLRDMLPFGGLVMEGRDIGSVVFPDAEKKIFLDADPEERARRRHAEYEGRDEASTIGNVQSSLTLRDLKDTQRKMAPLVVAEGAEILDTTSRGIDAVVEAILASVRG
ncbi:MAG: (d)CMP kinase [Verrucomicrobia bacterium]|nr:(d)CMP kinase [Verrucomicrobiota bacterium]MDA1086097.1 (d)CMP kinase [Verrucomicrobiota bacterium]